MAIAVHAQIAYCRRCIVKTSDHQVSDAIFLSDKSDNECFGRNAGGFIRDLAAVSHEVD